MLVGTSVTDITPAPGVELSGFAARIQPSTTVLDRLYARALCVEDGAERLLWIHSDLIALEREAVSACREWARRQLGLAERQVLITATHTHSGPATIHLQQAGTYDADYVSWLQGRFFEVACAAAAALHPCEVVHTEGRLDLAVDRRKRASAHTDPRVGAVGFRRMDGVFSATVVNYAMHAVALGPANRAISGDVPGQAARILAQRLPGAPVTLVTNGACGNLNPPRENVPFVQVETWGRQIANAVVDRLLAAAPLPMASFRTASRTVPIPLEVLDEVQIDARAARALDDARSLAEWGDKYRRAVEGWRRAMLERVRAGNTAAARDAELFAVRIGEVVLLGLNAEVFSEFTDWLRTATGSTVYVVGYANGDMGYIPTRAAYEEGGYEVDVAHIFYLDFRLQPGGLEQLATHATELVREVLSD
mgnify:CR=1 FL=1